MSQQCSTTGVGNPRHVCHHWHGAAQIGTLEFFLFLIIIILKNHSTMRQHNHYYRLFLPFILLWALPPSANILKFVTESSVLKWDQLIVFKPML